ncbi:aminoacetone oxidase family FAD-binding enzyme [Paramagnetospirillum kuznetsovii]|uniref:Aminoacetone oxidase family FAD-binding enzyme n=1 Tax=Paramagnetospirillum kuznetsovii TaxID=2053833 RepID=A0A364NVJ7_9PROT|nr:NAD(P)/FAD-dependent oxidoreductase [Paramagnetospirillum kuznetsovii]RAU21108.1 aminoacetone oxidase family FAD-binding enzyme [Paramagnetospirillum kuznetsovii]
MTRHHAYDVVVIGAGAAGLMAAAVAGSRGRRVLVLDHNDQPGRKILISGGGRCNFTNRTVTPANYLSANPHFATSALKRFGAADFLALVKEHRIAWHEREHGQLFCDTSAQLILDMLLRQCGAASVEIRTNCRIGAVTGEGPFEVATGHATVTAKSLIVATGGLSIPKIGATGFAHGLAKRYDLGVTPLAPALAPLTFSEPDSGLMRDLAGISLDAEVAFGKTRFREAVLFTHRGLSGPAILQISSYWKPGQPIGINLLPGVDAQERLLERKAARPNALVETIAAELLPARLARALTERAGLTGKPIGQTQNAALGKLAALLGTWSPVPAGTEGYRVAEATLGGVDTNQLSSKTMASKRLPDLYFIGEAVDVTGWLGGYNFQWAWSSGWVAGQSV